jgi:hypothetical protein
MENATSPHSIKIDEKHSLRPQYANAADATGFWFAAVVLLAVVAAVMIVYRTSSAATYLAANEPMPLAAQADPIAPPPIIR